MSDTAAAHESHGHHQELSFIRTYIFSLDHKMIGRQFLFMGLLMIIVGGLLAMLVRWQLAWPETPVPGLNFIPEPARAVAEMTRAARPGGVVAVYVWDYAEGMQMIRHFFDAAVALDPKAIELDEGLRFLICHPEPLKHLFESAGLRDVEVRAIDIPSHFKNFDDYWSPFLGGQGPAPGYAMSLSEERRAALRERIRAGLPIAEDGSIPLTARAWAIKGMR